MIVYCDSNFIVQLYLNGPGTHYAREMFREISKGVSSVPILWLHKLEVTNAFRWMVFSSKNGGPRVTPEQAMTAHQRFLDDLNEKSGPYRETTIVSSDLEQQFELLSSHHTANRGYRTYDILHVAAAILLERQVFCSFDVRAAQLAKTEGLKTFPPIFQH